MTDVAAPSVEVRPTGWAVGGDAVGRLEDGRVVFVGGAVPGDVVTVELTEQRPRFARGRVLHVVEGGPTRVEPTCVEVHRGCGGCDLAHVTVEEQRAAKAQMVHDALVRIGRLSPPAVELAPSLAVRGFRSTVRALVDPQSGRAGLRPRGSHESVLVESCEVAHPLVEELLVGGRYPGSNEVTIRAGLRTGDRLVAVDGPVAEVRVPEGVAVAGRSGRGWSDATIGEEIAGRRFRISAQSFFQSRPDGADQLVEVVRAAVADRTRAVGRLVDLCGGVGLFAATVPANSVTVVESSRSAVADARTNLADHPDARVIGVAMENWRPAPADVVIADPPRAGLGRSVVDRIAGTGSAVVVVVWCDAGSAGRDAGLLVAAGYTLEQVTLVDLFPQTAHVEVVAAFRRAM